MSPKVTPEYKKQRRNEILDVARNVFQEKGYAATSMADISERLTMSRGAIYQYFDNKEDVFLALLDTYDNQFIEELYATQSKSESVWQALELAFPSDTYEIANSQWSKFNAVIFEYNVSPTEDPERKFTRNHQRYERSLNAIIRFLQVGVDNNEFRPRYPLDVIADTLITFQDNIEFTKVGFKPDVVPLSSQAVIARDFMRFALGMDLSDIKMHGIK